MSSIKKQFDWVRFSVPGLKESCSLNQFKSSAVSINELFFFKSSEAILVPRAYDPSGMWLGSRALAGPDFLSMPRVVVPNSQPIRFARFDGKSVNRGLPVLDQTRALDPKHRPEGSIVGSWDENARRPAAFANQTRSNRNLTNYIEIPSSR